MAISETRSHLTERRERVLEVARTLFADRGYQATTMDDVATAAGFTKPILYQYFESKESLYNEIIEATSRHLLRELGKAVEHETTPRAMVESAFRVFFELVVNETSGFRLLFLQSTSSHELRRVESLITEFIEQLIPLETDLAGRRQLAAAIVGTAEGAATAWLYQQDAAGWPTTPADEVNVLAARISTLSWGGLRSLNFD